ncbi:MAG: AEC family transporter [Clostridia bacterium]|nr:AEC family transporter [Clostridia bacterium]
MQELLSLEFNIFVMVAVGFLVGKLKIVGKEGEKNITDLVLLVILPCNIFNSFMTKLTSDMAADCLWILGISIGIQVLAVIYGKLAFKKQTEDERCNLAYAMICSNAGFLGNPVAEGVFGSLGLMLGSIYLIPQRIMMWSEGLAIFSGVSDKKAAAKKVITHPCVIACILGLIVMISGMTVPALILAPIQTLAKCNTAMSMMVIGMILSEIDLTRLVDKTVAMFTIHRLVILPTIVFIACSLLPVSKTVTGVSTLLAAMPAGATTTMLASKYDRDPKFATRIVIFSTLCSIPAIMLWSLILKR